MSEYSKIYTPAIVGITLLLLIFVTRPLYGVSVENTSQITVLTNSRDEKQSDLSALKKMEIELIGDTTTDPEISALKKQVARYGRAFDPTNVMRAIFLNQYTNPGLSGEYTLIVSDVNIGNSVKLPNGLSKASVSVNVQANNIDTLLGFINELLQNTDIALTIQNISLPIDTGNLVTPPVG